MNAPADVNNNEKFLSASNYVIREEKIQISTSIITSSQKNTIKENIKGRQERKKNKRKNVK